MGVPDKLVMARTGHRSLASLHSYQHPSERSKEIVSDIIAGNSKSAEDDVNGSLRFKRKSSTIEEIDEGENKVRDIATSRKRRLSFEFANCKVVINNS